MAIALALSGTSGTITSYDGLVQAVSDWLKDPSLEDYVPTFIQLAEAYFRRVIVHVDREALSTATVSGEMIALPTDFLEPRATWINTSPITVLEPVSLADLKYRWGSQTGQPVNFAIVAGDMFFGPIPAESYTVYLAYQQDLTPLSQSTSSNWLLDSHPDIYLAACLAQAEFYGWNDERIPQIQSYLDGAIADLNFQSNRKRYSGPLRMRAPVVEVI